MPACTVKTYECAGTKVLAASVAVTEADMVDVLDYLCNAAFAWLKDAKSEQSYGSCDWTDSAFKRLHWKLKMPQGDSIFLDRICMSSPASNCISLMYLLHGSRLC